MQTRLAVRFWRHRRATVWPAATILMLMGLLLAATAMTLAAPVAAPPGPDSPDEPDCCTTPIVKPPAITCQEVMLNGVDTSDPQNALEVFPQQGNLQWQILVRNPEDTTPLNNVEVRAYHDGVHDASISITCRDRRLSEGESTICDGIGPIQPVTDLFDYQFIASGEPEHDRDNPVTHRSDACRSHYRVSSCEVAIEQYTNGADADEPCGEPLVLGEEVTWRFVISNIGEADLWNLRVTDNKLGAICSGAFLASGRSFECIANGRAEAGQFSNLSRVVANCGEDSPLEVTATDPCHYYTCPFDIEKGTNGFDADLPADAPTIPAGDMVTWSYAVNNISGFTLRDVVIRDDEEGEICRFASMGPGEMQVCTEDSVAGEEYAVGPPYDNLATVTGYNDRCNVICRDEDPSHYASSLPVEAEIVKNGLPWRYSVTNSGDMTLTNVEMDPSDGLTGPFFPCDDLTIRGPLLAVDERWCYRAEAAPTRAGYGREQRVAAETVEGAIPVSDRLPLLPYDDLTLSVFVDGEPVTPGVPLDPDGGGSTTWRYVALNNGTVPLTDVEFYHTAMSRVPNFAARCSFAELPAGGTKECTISEGMTAGIFPIVGSVQAFGLVDGEQEAFAQDVVVEFTQPGRIGGRIFHDLRPANNVRDPLERGVRDVRVELLNAAGAAVDEVMSGPDGAYLLQAAPGTYSVRFTAPGSVWCLKHAHANHCMDSDVNAAGETDQFDLAPGASVMCLDAGLGTPQSYLPLVER